MEEINTMVEAAYSAGKILKEAFFFSMDNIISMHKKQDETMVTEYDVKIENTLFNILHEKFPDYGFIGEEEHKIKKSKNFIIDPIDGTHNFIRKIPFFATVIALEENNEITAGVVYNPIVDMLFYGYDDKAFFNNKPMKCSNKKSNFITFCHGHKEPNLDKVLLFYNNVKRNYGAIKRLGSASLEINYVALGIADAFIGFGIHIWDFAASSVIAKNAGCFVEQRGSTIIVTKPALKEEISSFIE